MNTAHIVNAGFELELEKASESNHEANLEQHPIPLQLQFLPLLSLGADDGLVVTQIPNEKDLQGLFSLGLWKSTKELPEFITLNHPVNLGHFSQLSSWGYSQSLSQWALSHSIAYAMPPWETVKKVNSKVYSFENSPKLPHAQLIGDEKTLQEWLLQRQGAVVLKSAFGFSGRGHLIITDKTPGGLIHSFCHKEWANQRPVIAEPWMERVLDFSTQWKIDPRGEISLIGSTRIKNDSKGSYQSTLCGPEEQIFADALPFLEEHKVEGIRILNKLFLEGYYGPIGIDAMVYRDKNQAKLHPIVEINARQTMSLYALLFQRKWFPNRTVTISYTKQQGKRPGLLPTRLRKSDGEEIVFTRQLYAQPL